MPRGLRIQNIQETYLHNSFFTLYTCYIIHNAAYKYIIFPSKYKKALLFQTSSVVKILNSYRIQTFIENLINSSRIHVFVLNTVNHMDLQD